jgi:hypothetical protein
LPARKGVTPTGNKAGILDRIRRFVGVIPIEQASIMVFAFGQGNAVLGWAADYKAEAIARQLCKVKAA